MPQGTTFPLNKNLSFKSELIDALLDIRITLSIKRITSEFIKKSELKNIIDEAKKQKEKEVIEAIDDVFSEYFETKNIVNNETNNLPIEEVLSSMDNQIHQDSGGKNGISLVKADKNHRTGENQDSAVV